MRSLALLLILANIGLLFWQLKLLPWFPLLPEQFTPQVVKSNPETILGLPSLVLLNERELEEEIVVPPDNNTEPNLVEINAKDIVVTDIADKVSELIPELVPDYEVKDILTTDKVADIVTKNIKIDAKPIELPPVSSAKPVKEIVHACFKSGPYTKIDVAEGAVNWLEDNNISVILDKNTDKKLINTWVYLPSFKNLEEAKRIQTDLNKAGIKEHSIVKGKLKNAISLGVYGVPTNAAIRVKELQAKGYSNVKTREKFKESTNYWLNIKMLPDNLIDSFKKSFKDFTLTSVACESIALQQSP
ncbi:MAG: SPOR domain-containing protein [Proteobacteria bacterium]|nr:SPOR domain-containing protein [Pseudomonadota bacterium]